jgi:hypothetical protein
LNFAKHSQNNPKLEFDFLKDIKECMYDKIGQFQLIDKQLFGEEIQYYVPCDYDDNNFDNLLKLQSELIDLIKVNADRSKIQTKKKSIEIQLKKMSCQIVQVRLNKNQIKPLQGSDQHYFNLYKIDSNCYTFEYGVDLKGANFIL